jgi:hypothetical protein
VTPKQVARSIVEELQAYPLHWCQWNSAIRSDGSKTRVNDPEAVAWCLWGHVCKREPFPSIDMLEAFWPLLGSTIPVWNDRPGRTVEEVIQVCEKVINDDQS